MIPLSSTEVSKDIAYVILQCPSCGPDASSRVWLHEGGTTAYRKCLTCSTIFASPCSPAAERHEWMDRMFGAGELASSNEVARARALELEAKALQRYGNAGLMLDVGCDLGLMFQWFPPERWQRMGVDISSTAARCAEDRWGAVVIAGTLREASFPSASFDLVTMIDMLYYTEDPRAEINEARRILKAGAILGLEVPGARYQLLRSRGPFCWILDRKWNRLRSDSSYLYWFSVAGLFKLLREEGFEIVETLVVESPASTSRLGRAAARAHWRIAGALKALSWRTLTLAPKYLIVARRRP